MILIPEIETVLILIPRTGSGSLRRAIAKRYPQAIQIYRHMEADGVPQGYDRWEKLAVVRHPVERLWSLYKFMMAFGNNPYREDDPAYIESLRRSTDRPFLEWIVENEVVFTSPYDRAGKGRFYPGYTVRHPMPENRKSQFVYARPDLGTHIYHFEHLDILAQRLEVQLERHNTTNGHSAPALDAAARDHVERFFAWDIDVCGVRV